MKGSAARTPRSRPDAGASIRETAAGATVACAWGKADHACFRRKIKTGSLLHGGVPRRARMALDLSLLNPQQRKAVLQTEGPVLVLAGAGSGKTLVIAHRVVHLLGQGVPGGAILAVTFTNKAAAEMRERVLALAGGAAEARRVTVSTFHAFGMEVIREQHQALGLPAKFAILDGGDQAALLKRLLRDLKIDDKRFDVGRLLAIVSRLRSSGAAGHPDDDYEICAAGLAPKYELGLRAMSAVDFDDPPPLPVRRFSDAPDVLQKYHARCGSPLADEQPAPRAVQLL